MTPILNSMATTGIVALPGMMTGQILAGADPILAVKYQILIMFLIAAATALAAFFAGLGAVLLLTDKRHRLRLERLAAAKCVTAEARTPEASLRRSANSDQWALWVERRHDAALASGTGGHGGGGGLLRRGGSRLGRNGCALGGSGSGGRGCGSGGRIPLVSGLHRGRGRGWHVRNRVHALHRRRRRIRRDGLVFLERRERILREGARLDDRGRWARQRRRRFGGLGRLGCRRRRGRLGCRRWSIGGRGVGGGVGRRRSRRSSRRQPAGSWRPLRLVVTRQRLRMGVRGMLRPASCRRRLSACRCRCCSSRRWRTRVQGALVETPRS